MFEVEDVVRIRDWDELVDRFGLDSDGDIAIPGLGFVTHSNRSHICGGTGVISKIDAKLAWIEVSSFTSPGEDADRGTWYFHPDMLIVVSRPAFSENDFNQLLGL